MRVQPRKENEGEIVSNNRELKLLGIEGSASKDGEPERLRIVHIAGRIRETGKKKVELR